MLAALVAILVLTVAAVALMAIISAVGLIGIGTKATYDSIERAHKNEASPIIILFLAPLISVVLFFFAESTAVIGVFGAAAYWFLSFCILSPCYYQK